MAKTRRTISIDEKISKAEDDVKKAEEHLKSCTDTLNILLEKKKSEEMDKISKAIENSGKSVDEILKYLTT